LFLKRFDKFFSNQIIWIFACRERDLEI
jgi:hypothetical protein